LIKNSCRKRRNWEGNIIFINLTTLFEIQHKLDQKITETHQLKNKDLVSSKILALQVELAELANETRCFKFWSVKEPSPREVIVEEYVDGLHFILSLGLSKGYKDQVSIFIKEIHKTQIEAFAQLFDLISTYSNEHSLSHYQDVFQAFIDLGQVLGFSWSEIEQAYLEKNQVNHARQQQGY
jgi:dimeric dUTPase (all-alpha-NTP-PPase superfamily)